MSAPEWLQQAESWCASVENSNIGVMFIGTVVTLCNLAMFRALMRRLRRAFPQRRRTRVLVAVLFWLLLLPMIGMAVGGKLAAQALHHYVPTPLAVAGMGFQFAVWVYGGVLLLSRVGAHGLAAARRITSQPGRSPEHGPNNPERRELMAKAAFAMPAVILTTAAAGGVASQMPPVVRRVRQKVGQDFGHLHGFKFAQFSDVHIGSYLERDRLTEIADVLNSLRPDMVVCTGDLIDNQLDQLEHAQRLLGQLKTSHGTYMCMGNHEYIAADGDERAVREAYGHAGVNLLIDEAHRVDVGGSHFWLGGTDFPGAPGCALGDRPSTAQSMDAVLKDMDDDGAPRIVLAHHPKTFFEARERQMDLMLSGHTHGGQISLGRVDDHELTPNLPFEFYHKGLYEHQGRKLYVNSGIGSWLPVRINCPPEITLIELV